MTRPIGALLDQAVGDGVFPGAAVAWGHANNEPHFACAGQLAPGESAVGIATIYDVASLSKVMVTGLLAALAMDERRIELNRPIVDYLPEVNRAYTIRELLCHASGLPTWKPYYERMTQLLPPAKARELYLQAIAAEAPEVPPGVRAAYSDVGFILLGFVLEAVFQRDLRTLAQDRIFTPLGLEKTAFGPLKKLDAVAPTEICPVRKKVVRGEVNDLNCAALGGVAGHAGVFSTVGDVARFAQKILRNQRDEEILLPVETLRRFTAGERLPADSTWALSWDHPSPKDSSAGELWSKSGFGHLGFTGCSLWLDPDRDFFVVCLSNRTFPTAANDKIKKFRPQLHDQLVRMCFADA